MASKLDEYGGTGRWEVFSPFSFQLFSTGRYLLPVVVLCSPHYGGTTVQVCEIATPVLGKSGTWSHV